MGAISQLKAVLIENSIPFVKEGAMLTVKAKTNDGFDVSMIEEADEVAVFYEGWHEHFSSTEDAIKCFMFGLSSKCRICVTRRGAKAYKWTLEAFEDGAWVSYGTTSLFFFPFWKLITTTYLQNDYGD